MNEKEKLKEIIRLGIELNNVHDVDILLERILFEARKFVNADAGTIYIREWDQLVFSHTQNDTLQKKLPPGDKLIYSTFRVPINVNSLSGYVAYNGEMLNIPDVYLIENSFPYSFDPSYDNSAGYHTTSMLTVPLKTDRDRVIGVLQIINALDKNNNPLPFSSQDEMFIAHFASTASMVLQRSMLTRSMLLRMIQMAELRDPGETGAHVNRVASYSAEIYERWALHAGLSRDEIDKNRDVLRMAAILHDVGKVAISDLILKKPGHFNDEEYEIMKSHTFLGARLFLDSHSEFDEVACAVSLTHHENWDGTGYPGHIDIMTGLPVEKDSRGRAVPMKGEEISIYGRVVAIADVFDALSSNRVYKQAWSEKDVLKEIKSMSGTKFDPDIVDTFFESLGIIRSLATRYPDAD